MLSADISGFTALSERLAGKGKAGSEEITDLVNSCFTALISAAYGYDGEVVKFGGDALLVLFRGDQHEARCVNAAVAMHEALRTTRAAQRAQLSMTVGASHGPFDALLVGSGYRELLIVGRAATEVIRLEAEAPQGRALVSSALADAVGAGSGVVAAAAGGVVIEELTLEPTSAPMQRIDADTDVTAFVPPAVVDQFRAFAALGGEHRLATVGFVMVGGIDDRVGEVGHDIVAAELGDLIDDVVAIASPFGVTALHTDIATDGFKIVLCAGAPINPGDTSEAVLQAALGIAALPSPFSIRQGAQTGRVFAGFLGSEYRRTYTLMGDAVNTAARMLAKADDRDVVAVANVVDDARSVFLSEALEPFTVKGKTQPIAAHLVRSSTDEVRRAAVATRLFGRREELEVLTRAIGELGEVVLLTGAAGVGKSRLLDAAWDQAEGLAIFQGACSPYGSSSPYSAFRPLLRSGSGIDVHADPRSAGEQLTALVREHAPRLAPLTPLLAVPFGAEVDDTPEASAIEPEYRRPRIHDAVVEFLDATLSGPVFLVVEDLHWVDDASGDLANHLVRAARERPWAGVFTRRPTGAWAPPDLDHVTELNLATLTAEQIRALAIEVAPRALSDSELGAVVDRSGGNPLFAIELAGAIGRASPSSATPLPDSIEGVIAARIDDLPPGARQALRVASVFGRTFSSRDLAAAAGEGDDAAGVLASLGDLVEPLGSGQYGFVHALYRDVAYEGLPYRRRRELHRRVGQHLEEHSRDPVQIAALLSLHFSIARDPEKAWSYSRTAGELAQRAYANDEAATCFRRALTAARYMRSISSDDTCAVWEMLGLALENEGRFDEAFEAYRRQRATASDLDARVRATRRQARSRQKQGQLTAATRLLTAAERQLQGIRRDAWVHRRLAEIQLNMAGIRMDQGRLHESRDHGEKAEYHAMKSDDDALQVQAYGAIVGALTSWDEAEPYAAGLEIARRIEAFEAGSILATNLGMSAFFAGRWQSAVEFYEQSRLAAAATGNVTLAAIAAMNAAEILVDQGRLDIAIDALDDACRVLDAAGYKSALLYAELILGTATIRRGGHEAGRRLLAGCASGFAAAAMQLYATEAELRLAELALHEDDPTAAVDALTELVAASGELDRGQVIEARAQRLAAIARRRLSDDAAAEEALDRAEEICRAEGFRFELALTLLTRTTSGDGARHDEADRILRELGVVSVPFSAWQP